MVLRVCADCGLEAYNKVDLEKFQKEKTAKHGRRNLCKKCANKRIQKDPYYKKYRQRNADKKKTYEQNRKNHPLTRPKHLLSLRWYNMKNRCTNPNDISYPRYGGRGITICKQWLNNKTSFIQWALNHGFNEKLQLDRIDNNKEYSPKNCRFATRNQQMRNTSVNTTDFKNKTRICQRCKTNKPLTDYRKHKNKTLGREYICKPCQVKRQHTAKHKNNKLTHD